MLKSDNKVITKNTKYCRGIRKLFGLMFSTKNAVRNNALIFAFRREKQQSFHMWFVFYPIDLVFLNKKKQIVELKQYFKPFMIYNSVQKSMYVLEMESGTIKKKSLKIGDFLSW